MVGKILGALVAAIKSPFSLALGLVLLIAAGGVGGFFWAKRAEVIAKQKVEEARKAAEIAARAHIPVKVPQPDEGPDPFVPRYIPLGEEFTTSFREKKRVLIVQLTLVTRKGPKVEDSLKARVLPLRARVDALLSIFPYDKAVTDDGPRLISEHLRAGLNDTLRADLGINPVEDVLITQLFIQ
jgi:flagellar basal body-associated protein FliL